MIVPTTSPARLLQRAASGANRSLRHKIHAINMPAPTIMSVHGIEATKSCFTVIRSPREATIGFQSLRKVLRKFDKVANRFRDRTDSVTGSPTDTADARLGRSHVRGVTATAGFHAYGRGSNEKFRHGTLRDPGQTSGSGFVPGNDSVPHRRGPDREVTRSGGDRPRIRTARLIPSRDRRPGRNMFDSFVS